MTHVPGWHLRKFRNIWILPFFLKIIPRRCHPLITKTKRKKVLLFYFDLYCQIYRSDFPILPIIFLKSSSPTDSQLKNFSFLHKYSLIFPEKFENASFYLILDLMYLTLWWMDRCFRFCFTPTSHKLNKSVGLQI